MVATGSDCADCGVRIFCVSCPAACQVAHISQMDMQLDFNQAVREVCLMYINAESPILTLYGAAYSENHSDMLAEGACANMMDGLFNGDRPPLEILQAMDPREALVLPGDPHNAFAGEDIEDEEPEALWSRLLDDLVRWLAGDHVY